jgi:hypothetical protein
MRSDQEVMVREVIRRLELLGRESARTRDLLGLVRQWIQMSAFGPRVPSTCEDPTYLRVAVVTDCETTDPAFVTISLGAYSDSLSSPTGGYYTFDLTGQSPGNYTVTVTNDQLETTVGIKTVLCGETNDITIGPPLAEEIWCCDDVARGPTTAILTYPGGTMNFDSPLFGFAGTINFDESSSACTGIDGPVSLSCTASLSGSGRIDITYPACIGGIRNGYPRSGGSNFTYTMFPDGYTGPDTPRCNPWSATYTGAFPHSGPPPAPGFQIFGDATLSE